MEKEDILETTTAITTSVLRVHGLPLDDEHGSSLSNNTRVHIEGL